MTESHVLYYGVRKENEIECKDQYMSFAGEGSTLAITSLYVVIDMANKLYVIFYWIKIVFS